ESKRVDLAGGQERARTAQLPIAHVRAGVRDGITRPRIERDVGIFDRSHGAASDRCSEGWRGDGSEAQMIGAVSVGHRRPRLPLATYGYQRGRIETGLCVGRGPPHGQKLRLRRGPIPKRRLMFRSRRHALNIAYSAKPVTSAARITIS